MRIEYCVIGNNVYTNVYSFVLSINMRYQGSIVRSIYPLGLALGSPIFPSGCEGKLGVALNEVKFACVDGPEFDGHLVDFDEAMKRQQIYKTAEGRAYLKEKEGDTHHGGCGNCN